MKIQLNTDFMIAPKHLLSVGGIVKSVFFSYFHRFLSIVSIKKG